MKMIRASYSFLHTWSQGKIREALLSYFHVKTPVPWQYVNGKRWDEYATEYIKNNAKLPQEWGSDRLKAPIVQMKTQVPYNAICTLTGVFDIYDNKIIYELKSGHSASARQYAGTHQIPLYFLLAELAKIPASHAIVIRYNPRTDNQDRAEIHKSKRIIEKARNYLDSLVPEIYQYFEENDLFNKTDEEMSRLLISTL